MSQTRQEHLPEAIISGMGGAENIRNITHCATRIRAQLADDKLADDALIRSTPGVLAVVRAGGQFQIVIGDGVENVYAGIEDMLGRSNTQEIPAARPSGNILNRAIALISDIVRPLIWPLAGMGLFKALLTLGGVLGWFDPKSPTTVVLTAAADALFYFLPMFIAISTARRFKTHEFTSMIIAGALVYPSIVAIADGTATSTFGGVPIVITNFAGIPLVAMHYVYSVIPIAVAVWVQGYLERWLQRWLPELVRSFMTPFFVVLVMVPLILLTIGPLTTLTADGLSGAIEEAFKFAPWLAGGLLGGIYQVLVIFGLHWATDPIVIQEISLRGYSLIAAPLVPAVLAQGSAAIAVALRTRSAARRRVALAAAASGFVAGVTEPAIYGSNLPLRRPFAFALVGGAVGGAIVASGGVAPDTFISFYSVLSMAAFLARGSAAMLFIGVGAAIVIPFALTFLFVNREQVDQNTDEHATPAADTPVEAPGHVRAPVAGRMIALERVPDQVFASGTLGGGFGVVPDDGHFVAPVSGTVVAVFPSGHAYGLKTDDGMEVLIHIGIDTVQLEGRGFTSLVDAGQRVTVGGPLAEVDLAAVKGAGFDTTTIVVVTNSSEYSSLTPVTDTVINSTSPALIVKR
ncbi:beta-glucoside-specific PTS transporter subunit IIABC [Curtobacterium sp. NPDC089689]|uniref:beta-glucoside-specific PTS transporter subunit IIABC n=1 Tax=Curtobacterium sp. NPDC089689 TaxID=3363968 RepID=UPI003817D57C